MVQYLFNTNAEGYIDFKGLNNSIIYSFFALLFVFFLTLISDGVLDCERCTKHKKYTLNRIFELFSATIYAVLMLYVNYQYSLYKDK
jgi:hypothetical protein